MLKKNDIKYIIKRVIIILLTGFVFFNISKCNAYALSTDYYIKANDTNVNPTFLTSAPDSSYFVNSYNVSNINFHFYYYYSSGVFDEVLFFIFDYNDKYYLFANYYKKTDTDLSNLSYYKVVSDSNSLSYPPNIYFYDNNDNNIGNLSTSSSLNGSLFYGNSFEYSYYEIDLENVSLTRKNDSNLAFNILENGTIVYTNSTKSLHVNDIIKDLPINVPTGYTEVDLTGYQGVVFVPKDYSSLDITTVEIDTGGEYNKYINYYRFPFYYTGCVNYGYFPLNNTSSLVVDTSSMSMCSNSPIFFDGLFPIYYNDDDLSSYAYNGVIVYNRNINNISNDNVVYLSSSVWYVSSMFDYYLVEDFSTFTGSFTFNDRDGNEMSIDFTRMYSFEDIINGINIDEIEDLDNLTTKQKISAILEFFKTPVNFMKNIYNGTCEPLIARFPHSNQDIVLPCLSSQFEEFLSPSAYTIIRLLINGLLTYRILNTMLLFFVSFINPDSTTIEVIDL